MPSLTDLSTNSTPIKTLLVGHSGAGKSGALASLAAAGYNLRILDYDNGLPVLKDYLTNPNSIYVKQNPACATNVRFRTLTDSKKNVGGTLQTKSAKAWSEGMKLLTHWKETDPTTGEITDLGPLETWTTKDILVIDSLTKMSDAAYNFHLQMNGRLLSGYSEDTYGKDVGATQRLIKGLLDLLNDEGTACNVILISHLSISDEVGRALKPKEDGHAFPSSIGKALGPQIPRWFNNMLFVKEVGTKRQIFTDFQTTDGNVVSTKSSAPLRVKKSYPLETGLADYFRDLRGE